MPREGGPELNAGCAPSRSFPRPVHSALVEAGALRSFGAVRHPVHVIDFEGTRESGILEYGVVTVRGGAVESSHTRLCAATGAIREPDRRRHGLSGKRLAGLPPFAEEWPLFSGLRQSGPLCAHNVAVEDGLIRAVWPHPRGSPDFTAPGGMDARWGPWLDTLQLYRNLHPDLPSHRLEDLIETFDLAGQLRHRAAAHCPPARCRYHCALFDAFASALLLLRLFDDPALAEQPLSWWLAASASSSSARQSFEQGELF